MRDSGNWVSHFNLNLQLAGPYNWFGSIVKCKKKGTLFSNPFFIFFECF